MSSRNNRRLKVRIKIMWTSESASSTIIVSWRRQSRRKSRNSRDPRQARSRMGLQVQRSWTSYWGTVKWNLMSWMILRRWSRSNYDRDLSTSPNSLKLTNRKFEESEAYDLDVLELTSSDKGEWKTCDGLNRATNGSRAKDDKRVLNMFIDFFALNEDSIKNLLEECGLQSVQMSRWKLMTAPARATSGRHTRHQRRHRCRNA